MIRKTLLLLSIMSFPCYADLVEEILEKGKTIIITKTNIKDKPYRIYIENEEQLNSDFEKNLNEILKKENNNLDPRSFFKTMQKNSPEEEKKDTLFHSLFSPQVYEDQELTQCVMSALNVVNLDSSLNQGAEISVKSNNGMVFISCLNPDFTKCDAKGFSFLKALQCLSSNLKF